MPPSRSAASKPSLSNSHWRRNRGLRKWRDVLERLRPQQESIIVSEHMTPEEAQRIIADFSKNKEHFADVRNLMGALAHSEILASAHGHDTGTGFVKGPNDWNLDALYKSAVAAHPGVQAKIAASRKGNAQSQQKPSVGSESVRDLIQRAMSGKPTDKPQRESVRDLHPQSNERLDHAEKNRQSDPFTGRAKPQARSRQRGKGNDQDEIPRSSSRPQCHRRQFARRRRQPGKVKRRKERLAAVEHQECRNKRRELVPHTFRRLPLKRGHGSEKTMKVTVELTEPVLNDLQRTSFISRDQRSDVMLLRELVAFMVIESARDLPTAMRFSLHLQGLREQKHQEWQKAQSSRDYYSNELKGGAA